MKFLDSSLQITFTREIVAEVDENGGVLVGVWKWYYMLWRNIGL